MTSRMDGSGRQLSDLLLLVGVATISMLPRLVLGPLLPAMERELGLSHAQAGGLLLVQSAGYFVSTLVSGFIAERLHHRRVIAISLFISAVASLTIAMSRSQPVMMIGIVSAGLAHGLYFSSAFATVTGLAPQRHRGGAIALHEGGISASFVLAPLIVQLLSPLGSWRATLAVVAAASALVAGIFVGCFRGGRFFGDAPRLRNVRRLAPRWRVLGLVFAMCVVSAAALGVFSMLPLYLTVERGLAARSANYLLAASRISAVFLGFLSGLVIDRVGARPILLVSLLVLAVTTPLLALPAGPGLIVAVLLQPVFAAVFFTAALVALSSVFGARSRSLAISLTTPFVYLAGGGVAPALWGRMGDSGLFSLGFVFLGGALVIGTVTTWLGLRGRAVAQRPRESS